MFNYSTEAVLDLTAWTDWLVPTLMLLPVPGSVALIAQASGGAFFVAGVILFGLIAYKMFLKSAN